jgi:hypothetical protein
MTVNGYEKICTEFKEIKVVAPIINKDEIDRMSQDGEKFINFTVNKKSLKQSFYLRNINYAYELINNSGGGCNLYFSSKYEKLFYIDFFVKNIKINALSSADHGHCIVPVLQQLETIEKELAEMEKNQKIDDMAKTSIETWIDAILTQTNYAYYTEATKTGITLCVRIKKHLQMNIPITYKSFLEIMPGILKTIHDYENFIKDQTQKIFIIGAARTKSWKNRGKTGDMNEHKN